MRGLLPGAALLVLLVAACSGDGDDAAPSGGGGPAAVSVVSQNILHGEACPPDSDKCALPDRVALFAEQLGRTCPGLVAVQEANARIVDVLTQEVAGICDGRYEVVSDDDPGLDREIVLTMFPVVAQQRFRLAGPLRTALWVRLATDLGAIDLWTTHLASGSDDRPCDTATCPPPCEPDDTLQLCQARQVVERSADLRAPDGVLVVAGDLNATPDQPTMAVFRDAGLVDPFPVDGGDCTDRPGAELCTSGRDDASMADLTDPANHQTQRIDYVLWQGRDGCEPGVPGGVFEPEPEEGGPDGLAFPSDHSGVVATIGCPTTAAQREAASAATIVSTTTTTIAALPPDDPQAQAVAAAFTQVFAGTSGIDERLAALDDPEGLHDLVTEGYESSQAIADRITVEVDSVTLPDPDHADVVFSLLLDDAAVLDALPGQAVRSDDGWLVTTRTFCSVATQGRPEIPEVCT